MSKDDKRAAFNEAIEKDAPENVDIIKLQVRADNLAHELGQARKNSKHLRRALQNEQQAIATLLQLETAKGIPKIKVPKKLSKKPRATACSLFGDAHIEEQVISERVNGLNFYDLAESKRRVELYFIRLVEKLKHEQKHWSINDLVVFFLGDYITGYIHEEFVINNFLTPTEATFEALEYLMCGIDYLLEHAPVEKIIIPCNYGNHGRNVKWRPHSVKAKMSYEWLLYQMLRLMYKKAGEDRVEFHIADGTLIYHDIGDFRIRANHGDTFNYRGGLGGVTIPMYGAINSWSKSIKADLDVMGHWHQFKNFRNSIINGSVIGYSEFAVDIRAEFEPPSQAFFLINHERNVLDTVHPIYVT